MRSAFRCLYYKESTLWILYNKYYANDKYNTISIKVNLPNCLRINCESGRNKEHMIHTADSVVNPTQLITIYSVFVLPTHTHHIFLVLPHTASTRAHTHIEMVRASAYGFQFDYFWRAYFAIRPRCLII